jgi:hypothetical protein
MDSSKFKLILVFVLAVFAALYLGITAATAQVETIAWVLGGTTIAICLLLGRRIWLLIPFLAAVNLSLRIPGQPNTLLLAQVLVMGFSVLLVATKKIALRPRLSELEFWMIGLLLMVLQVYARNPAGVWIFGGDTVGGKAYFVFFLTFITSLFLCSFIADVKDLKKVFTLSIIGTFINLITSITGNFVPIIGYYTGANYSIDQSNTGQAIDAGRASRHLEVSNFGQKMALWISSYRNPLRALMSPLWLSLIILSGFCALFGGFRSGFAALVMTYIVGTWYRGGFASVIIGSLMGGGAIALLALVNTLAPLPPNMQRALTILPGTWDQRYVDDAKGSTEWRVEIWKEVLFTDRWIANKVFGDGLGFSKQQLAYQMTLQEGQMGRIGASGWDLQREGVIASGDYHSGPVSTIRVVGYVGLAFVLLFQIRLAVHAHRQIIRCRGTEWYSLSLLIGIPMIWGPVFFHFIFGDFRSECIALLLGTAMVRMLERGLPLPTYATGRRMAVAPLSAGRNLAASS